MAPKAKTLKPKKLKKPTKRVLSKRASRRDYDNVSREIASAESRKAIIDAYVDLLVETRGADVAIADVAKRSTVSERTIFRFFKDKAALLTAAGEYISTYIQQSNDQLSVMSLVSFVQQTFRSFDGNPNLIMAYLFSPFGQQARGLFRKRLNKVLIDKIHQDYGLEPSTKATSRQMARVALIATLVNTRVWYEMKTDFGLPGSESGDVVAWAIRTLVRDLNKD